MATQIYVNLSVKDLNATKEFFTKLGFTFNPKFTNESGACMVVSDTIFVMLLLEPFFMGFTKKEICDTKVAIESIIAISAESREKVDEMANNAVAAGGTITRPVEDHGWMYSQAFTDIDGHQWEVLYADESLLQK